jgi:hypothetical protein
MLDSISGLASLFYEHETDMLASIKQVCSRAYPPLSGLASLFYAREHILLLHQGLSVSARPTDLGARSVRGLKLLVHEA